MIIIIIIIIIITQNYLKTCFGRDNSEESLANQSSSFRKFYKTFMVRKRHTNFLQKGE